MSKKNRNQNNSDIKTMDPTIDETTVVEDTVCEDTTPIIEVTVSPDEVVETVEPEEVVIPTEPVVEEVSYKHHDIIDDGNVYITCGRFTNKLKAERVAEKYEKKNVSVHIDKDGESFVIIANKTFDNVENALEYAKNVRSLGLSAMTVSK